MAALLKAGLAYASLTSKDAASFGNYSKPTIGSITGGWNNITKTINGAHTGYGLSPLGMGSMNLPAHLGHSWPWGSADVHTNYYDYSQVPDTGVTRYYNWTVSKGNIAPDGVEIPGLLINGEFPGPLLEANWGDYVQVNLINDIDEEEGASIHWHGILQKDTQSYDGVPGVSQCPVPYGNNLTYLWRANMYGTSWYHSHYSSQYASGLVGPMVIYGPQNHEYDIDVGPITVSDWYHEYYTVGVDYSLQPIPNTGMPAMNNVLINGKNNYPCNDTTLPCIPNAGLASFNFTAGKSHRLRVVNTAAAATMKVSLDGHNFTVIANDFVPIEPYVTDVLTLGVGQRNDVIVYADGQPGESFYLRAYAPPNCAVTDDTSNSYANAIVYYEGNGAGPNDTPNSLPQPNWDNNYCGNDDLSLTVPTMSMAPGDPEETETVVIQFMSNGTHLLWYQNGRTMRIDYNDPLLSQAINGTTEFPFINNVYNYGANKSVRFIFENHSGMVHPMHFHGHNLFVLDTGYCPVPANLTALIAAGKLQESEIAQVTATATVTGTSSTTLPTSVSMPTNDCWNGTITRPDNPQRRDVQQLLPGGYIVVQWNQDNPGVWPFHCHIAWHISQGFALYVLEQPDEVVQDVSFPANQVQNCQDWMAYTNRNVVDDIDSGI